jgi:alginate O-acetyltransferase complex protein AlgI
MTLALILISIVIAGLLGLVRRYSWRVSLLLASCVLAGYAFQPVLPVRYLDFWFPTASLAIITLTWILTTHPENRSWNGNWSGAAIMGGIVLLLGLTRYLDVSTYLTASTPPQALQILSGLAGFIVLAFLLVRYSRPHKGWLVGAFLIILLLFIILKVPYLAGLISRGVRSMNHQSTSLALAQDLRWLGFSYIAFRLLHTIRDRLSGRLPDVSLSEYVIFIYFFPALSAGPIDRIERFIGDLRRPGMYSTEDLGEAGKRLAFGLFKKFVIADILAMIALNQVNAFQIRSAGWAWILIYAYAFQIYFDFSGYTDIAIGLARLLGIRLPENFNAPYLKPNLTQFWNSWHITLTQWFRAYFFNPLTRALRSGSSPLPTPLVILFTQLATMILIGLWHGATLNFVVWGLWHGLGLFVHNRWSEMTRRSYAVLPARWQVLSNAGGVLLTFNFVALGWIFFALPDLSTSIHVFRVLLGLA